MKKNIYNQTTFEVANREMIHKMGLEIFDKTIKIPYPLKESWTSPWKKIKGGEIRFCLNKEDTNYLYMEGKVNKFYTGARIALGLDKNSIIESEVNFIKTLKQPLYQYTLLINEKIDSKTLSKLEEEIQKTHLEKFDCDISSLNIEPTGVLKDQTEKDLAACAEDCNEERSL